MTEQDTTARNRWLTLTIIRIIGSVDAVFGVVLLGRAQSTSLKILGVAIVLAALAMIAIVPRSLARRWRTPPEA